MFGVAGSGSFPSERINLREQNVDPDPTLKKYGSDGSIILPTKRKILLLLVYFFL